MLQRLGQRRRDAGFTLIEVLAVIVILFIVFAMVLPTGPHDKHKSNSIICLSQQKQNALGFILWNGDHGDQFPWEVSTTNGGTLELSEAGSVAPNFQLLTNYPKTTASFVCPTDKSKVVAANPNFLTASNISYFLALDTATNPATAILSGDRHLAFSNAPVKPGLVTWRAGEKAGWTRELHNNSNTPIGVLSFHDGHSEVLKESRLNETFSGQGLSSERLVLP